MAHSIILLILIFLANVVAYMIGYEVGYNKSSAYFLELLADSLEKFKKEFPELDNQENGE